MFHYSRCQRFYNKGFVRLKGTFCSHQPATSARYSRCIAAYIFFSTAKFPW